MTVNEYNQKKVELKQMMIDEIKGYTEQFGSADRLSIMLGCCTTYVHTTLARESYGAVEKLWKRCKGLK